MIVRITDLYLVDLSLWLVFLYAAPIAFGSFCATSRSIPQNELVLTKVGYFIDRNKVVFIVELVDGWEVSVLLAALDWRIRIRISIQQDNGKLVF